MSSLFKKIFRIGLPFLLGLGILWWMYRDTSGEVFLDSIFHQTDWRWMGLSLLFGIVPQVIRALRWQQALEPLGEKPRRSVCVNSIFVSYAASLVIPRSGEVTRCATLKRMDGVSFTKSLGTVVTERLIDSVLMLIFTGIAFLWQLPVFLRFLRTTGFNVGDLARQFSTTGYLVTVLCLLAAVLLAYILVRGLKLFRKGHDLLRDVISGVLSLKKVRNLPLYFLYSVLIWVGYFLHFYIAFFCFDATSGILPGEAFLIFCVGSFAVLVPTPNGAGPWHFAVKTMLVLYGVAEEPAVMFALVVHTVQTALVVLLGIYGWAQLNTTRRIPAAEKK